MTLYDHRTVSEDQVSYYVVDDLRAQFNQNRPDRRGWDIFRFDDINSALAKFREIPEDMTPAIGMHRSNKSELDLIHRREGECVLVCDYQNIPTWRADPAVLEAVSCLLDELSPRWKMDSRCIGELILVPLEHNFHRAPDPCFESKELRPKPPKFYLQEPSSLSAINEAYVEGEGWMNFETVYDQACDNKTPIPRVSQFNVDYVDDQGRQGQIDCSPLDLKILRERHILRHSHNEAGLVTCTTHRLAEEIASLTCHPNAKEYPEYLESLQKQLCEGDLHQAKEVLETMRDYGGDWSADSEWNVSKAKELLARLKSLPEKKPSLEHQMEQAGKRAGIQQTQTPNRQHDGPEH